MVDDDQRLIREMGLRGDAVSQAKRQYWDFVREERLASESRDRAKRDREKALLDQAEQRRIAAAEQAKAEREAAFREDVRRARARAVTIVQATKDAPAPPTDRVFEPQEAQSQPSPIKTPKVSRSRKPTPPQLLKETRERHAARILAKNDKITAEALGRELGCHKSTVTRLKAWKAAHSPLPKDPISESDDGE